MKELPFNQTLPIDTYDYRSDDEKIIDALKESILNFDSIQNGWQSISMDSLSDAYFFHGFSFEGMNWDQSDFFVADHRERPDDYDCENTTKHWEYFFTLDINLRAKTKADLVQLWELLESMNRPYYKTN